MRRERRARGGSRGRFQISILAAATWVISLGADPSCAASSLGVASSLGAPDTTLDRPGRSAALVPFAIRETEPGSPCPASPEWLTEPRFRLPGVSLLARRLTCVPLGISWTRWAGQGRPDSCETFRGHQYSIPLEDYWVYRCSEHVAGGGLDTFTYLIREGQEPTLERARWSFEGRADLRAREVGAFYEALVDTLAGFLGPPAPSDLSGPGSASWQEKWDFQHAGGVLTTYRVSVSSPGFVIELRSRELREAAAEAEQAGGEDEEAQGVEVLRHEVVEALGPRWPRLARAVGAMPSSISAAPAWREALASVRRRGPGGAEDDHDLVHVAAHVWMLGFDYPALADTLVRGELESMRDVGVRLEPSHYVDFCYRGSLLDPLIARAGTNRWTDQAFLGFQEMGWEEACDCGGSPFPGSDRFRPVIERGEAFLEDHPRSAVWNAVALTVAQAHETAWSLARGRCEKGDIGWDWKDYVLEAPGHRERAIELFEELIRRAPENPAVRSARRRLQRLRLDVDTNYHHYWCGMD